MENIEEIEFSKIIKELKNSISIENLISRGLPKEELNEQSDFITHLDAFAQEKTSSKKLLNIILNFYILK